MSRGGAGEWHPEWLPQAQDWLPAGQASGGGALWGQVWRKERHRVVLRMLKDKSWGPEVIAGGWPGP